MKNLAPLLAVIVMLLQFSSCKDDDTIKPVDVSNTLVSGTWKVSHFSEEGDDETSDFNGYGFTFAVTSVVGNSSGLVEATNGSTDVVGTWSTSANNNSAKLIMNFDIAPFDELSEDWRVTERSDTSIKMEHVSGGNGGTDLLTFEKI